MADERLRDLLRQVADALDVEDDGRVDYALTGASDHANVTAWTADEELARALQAFLADRGLTVTLERRKHTRMGKRDGPD